MKDLRNKIIINRTNRAFCAQCVDEEGKTLVSKRFIFKKNKLPVEASRGFGIDFGKMVKEKKVNTVCFCRNGRLYHGRVKAFAEGLREAGINF